MLTEIPSAFGLGMTSPDSASAVPQSSATTFFPTFCATLLHAIGEAIGVQFLFFFV